MTVLLAAGTATTRADVYGSRYQAAVPEDTLIENVRLLDGVGGERHDVSVLMQDGKIVQVANTISAASDAMVIIDGTGRWLTPGIIDVHSHIGTSPTPEVVAHDDGNERGDPNTADVWILHSFWPQGPGLVRAAAGGVTTFQIMPGSSNIIGGRTAVIKNIPRRTGAEMLFPGAKQGLKLACGENPKKNYRTVKGVYFSKPHTRMGNVAFLRQALFSALAYLAEKAAASQEAKRGFVVDLRQEALADLLARKTTLQVHCYRADDMAHILGVAEEFNIEVAAFHHALEAYKIRDILSSAGVCVATWADQYGAKMEMYDGIPENAALFQDAGGCTILHSDSDFIIQRLNQEAAKALAAGQRMGLKITKAEAWSWISSNPAKLLGVADVTGSLEVGKNADAVLWSGDPFSVYAKADIVWVDGVVSFDRKDPAHQRVSDFELGQPGDGRF